MTGYLIYRHGVNSKNQPMTHTMAVAIVQAETAAQAAKIAVDNLRVYNGQQLEVVSVDDLTAEQTQDWNNVSNWHAQLRDRGEEGCCFSA